MLEEVKLPQWGMAQDEASISEWSVSVGQFVTEGDQLAIVETAKALVEFYSPVSGVVSALLIEPDDVVAVGTVVAHIDVS